MLTEKMGGFPNNVERSGKYNFNWSKNKALWLVNQYKTDFLIICNIWTLEQLVDLFRNLHESINHNLNAEIFNPMTLLGIGFT